jgi:CubicO group peptidase (beta-lactamase class C family)
LNEIFPDFVDNQKPNVTIDHLLRHEGGLAAGLPLLDLESYEQYLNRILKAPLSYQPGTKMVYSDIAFIILGHALEKYYQQDLKVLSQKNVFTPLKMNSTFYGCPEEQKLNCVPTSQIIENHFRIHDPVAKQFSKNSLGHAGVFTTLHDLGLYGQFLLGKSVLDGRRLYSEAWHEKMTTILDGQIRGLGFDVLSPFSTAPRGNVFEAGTSYGHTGFTGTTLWIDPVSRNFYGFLSNRTYDEHLNNQKAFIIFRKNLATAIGEIVTKNIPN